MITVHSAVGGIKLGYVEIEQVSEAISLITSLLMSSVPSSPLIIQSLELMKLEAETDKPVLEEDFSQHGTLVTP